MATRAGTLGSMGAAGLFGPGTMTWRINREGALLLGGGRALVLQVAHPLVAAGVAEVLNYREDPLGGASRAPRVTNPSRFRGGESPGAATHTALSVRRP